MNRVDGDAQTAISTVLEADRRRQPRSQLAVHLAFGGARADGTPRDEIGDVLRRNHVEEFAARRHAQTIDVDQHLAGNAQPFIDAETLVQIRIVDQPLPAHRGARFFEIHPHDDFQLARMLFAQHRQPLGVVERGLGVVDRARADDEQQPVVLAVDDAMQRMAGIGHQRFHRGIGDGKEADQMLGRRQGHDVLDAGVVGAGGLVLLRFVQGFCGGFGRHRNFSSKH